MVIVQVDPELTAIQDALTGAVYDRKVASILFSVTRDAQTKEFLLSHHYGGEAVKLPQGTSSVVFVAIARLMADAYDYGVRRGREGLAANIRNLIQAMPL